MTVKKMELAFQPTRFSEGMNRTSVNWGNTLRRNGDLKWVKTKDPRVEVGYEKEGKDIDFYVFFDGKCAGYVDFHYFEAPKEIKRLFKGKKVAVPHVGMMPEMRGLGYPSMIYGLALKSGTVLVTDHHTEAAAGLWEAVARKYRAKIGYTDVTNGWKLSPTSVDEDDWKVMYL